MISYVLPTRDRPEALDRTLRAIGELSAASHEAVGGGEVIVIDNASMTPTTAPRRLANGLPVHAIRLEANLNAAARNLGAATASGRWLLMLDDDSYPLDDGHLNSIRGAPPNIAAIGGEILLPDGSHEAGGLPEVFVGCGALVRRRAFLDVGGYDPAFEYYAEEYDLCAKLIRLGWSVTHDFRFRTMHERASGGRDANRMLHHLVRNNAWVIRRYVPAECDVAGLITTMTHRYRRIASRENAEAGFRRGLADMTETLGDQPHHPMSRDQWDRFAGASAVREGLRNSGLSRSSRVAIVEAGKGVEVIQAALEESGIERVLRPGHADAVVIGTLSPGPLWDGAAQWAARGVRVVLPWKPQRFRLRTPLVASTGSER